MSIRNLDRLFAPRSVAVIGASDSAHSLGAILMQNLLAGGFGGPIWPVNPKHKRIAGQAVFADVASLPQAPDLAVVCTPAHTVPSVIAELGRRGTRAAVVLTAGLGESAEPGGPSWRQQMLDAARPQLLRILGPNCVGLLVPGIGLNASFAHRAALPGPLAFVSQSGALTTAMLDWAQSRGIGFSHFISLGDSADVDFGDALDYLGSDGNTRAILMYVESVQAARKFMSAARAAARNKPVLLVKAGRAPEGAKAAASHTGALAGSDVVFDAAVRRAGMLRVNTLSELFDAAETLSRVKRFSGERLTIMTNGGGAGVLAADALALGGGHLSDLPETSLQALNAVLPPTWSKANPVDIIGDAPVQRYLQTLEVLLQDPDSDALLFMHAPTAIVPSADIAKACAPLLQASAKPVLACWLGGDAVTQARQVFTEAGIPGYETPEQAASAFLQLVNYQRNQQQLLEVPPSQPEGFTPDRAAAQQLIKDVLAERRQWLNEVEAKALLAAYGIPVVSTRVVKDAAQAESAAAEIGFPVVLKILSPAISHKSDVGGVALNLSTAPEVADAARGMLERVRQLRPDAVVQGFTVQAMIKRPHAHELIVGVATDPIFGPVMLFGQGGVAVEVIADRAVALPPLNLSLARHLVQHTRVAKLLAGYRDRAAVDHAALELALVKVSQLVCDCPQLIELDINPLLADDQGVIALDARVKVAAVVDAVANGGTSRLAIRPYPNELEERLQLGSRSLLLRPVRPEDQPLLQAFYAKALPQDLRLRFFGARRTVPRSELLRFTQIDYDREMALIAVDDGGPGAPTAAVMLGEVRVSTDPDNLRAELAIMVGAGLQGQGLGRLLMGRMIDYLKNRGTAELAGECLRENEGMAGLARSMGFVVERSDDGQTWQFTMALQR